MEHLLVYAYCCECERNYVNFLSEDSRKLTCPYCKISNDFWKDGETPPTNHQKQD